MKWRFEEDQTVTELEVLIRKNRYDEDVQDILDYLDKFYEVDTEIFPIRTPDKVQLLRVSDVILIEVANGELSYETLSGHYQTTERLAHFQERVSHKDLVQISRHAMLNIQHLQYLEASFSGNMTAFLSKGVKTTISRRYLKTLEKRLGL